MSKVEMHRCPPPYSPPSVHQPFRSGQGVLGRTGSPVSGFAFRNTGRPQISSAKGGNSCRYAAYAMAKPSDRPAMTSVGWCLRGGMGRSGDRRGEGGRGDGSQFWSMCIIGLM